MVKGLDYPEEGKNVIIPPLREKAVSSSKSYNHLLLYVAILIKRPP